MGLGIIFLGAGGLSLSGIECIICRGWGCCRKVLVRKSALFWPILTLCPTLLLEGGGGLRLLGVGEVSGC